MLHTDRRQISTCMPERCAAARNVFMTLWPRKSVSRMRSCVPEGNWRVFFWCDGSPPLMCCMIEILWPRKTSGMFPSRSAPTTTALTGCDISDLHLVESHVNANHSYLRCQSVFEESNHQVEGRDGAKGDDYASTTPLFSTASCTMSRVR